MSPTPNGPTPDDPPRAPTSFDLEANQLMLPGPIVFETGSAVIDEAKSGAALAHIHDFLGAKTDVTLVRIEGHSDGSGDKEDVMDTGERANSVGNWLVAHGVDCKRLLIAGFGGTKPVADASTAQGRAQNRRIEVHVAELRGHLIGGMAADGDAPAAVPGCP